MIVADVSAGSSRGTLHGVAAGVCAGAMIGALILLVSGGALKWMLVLAALGGLPALLVVLGSMTRVLQALLVFSLSMSLDVYPGFSERFAETRPGVPVGITALLLVCLFVMGLLDRPGHAPRRVRAAATVPFGLLIVWAALTLIVAPRPDFALQALPGYITAFLLYLYALRLMVSRDGIRFTCTWIALGVLCSGAIALVQYLTGGMPGLSVLGGSETQIVQGYQHEQISRVSGLLRHPNTFSVFLNGFLPLLLVLAFTVRERVLRLLCAAAFGLGAIALVLTYSRGGWVSFAVSVALLLVAGPKWHWRPGLGTGLAAVSAVCVMLVVLVATPLYSRIATRLGEDDQGAASSRGPLAKASIDLIAQHPITGAGVGNYQFVSPIVTDDRGVPLIEAGDGRPMRAHNLFLFTAVELGLPGALLLATTIVLFFTQAVAVIRRGPGLPALVGLGLVSGLAAILTHCMLEPATLADPSYLVLSFVGGCLTGLAKASAT